MFYLGKVGFKMKKKLLSLVMACAMALSLAIPAFATDPYYQPAETDNDNLAQSVEFTVTTFVPTIDLAIPVASDNPVVLNPYKLSYTGDDNTLNGQVVGSGADKTKQVISPVYAITNKTNVALKFSLSATTTLGSDATFTFDNKHVKLNESAKKAFIQLVFKKTESATAAPGSDTTQEQTLDVYDTANYETIILAAGKKDSDRTLKRLAASPVDTNGEATGNYLLFQFQGSLSRTPETGWTADDIFTTTLAFTFTPEGNQDYTATLPIKIAGLADTALSANVSSATAATVHTAAATDTANITLDAASLPSGGMADGTNLANSTDAGYSMISGGAYGATLDTSTGNVGKIVYPKELGKTLAISGTAYKDYLVVGFNDEHGVPRTIGIDVSITRALS